MQALRSVQHSRLPSTATAAATTVYDTRGSSRSTVDTAVGEQSCVHLLRHVQLSPLLPTDTAAASTNTHAEVTAADPLSTLPSVR